MKIIEIPTVCPICGKPLVIEKKYNTKVLKCANQFCKAKTTNRVLHFIGAHGLDIEGMSVQTVNDLVDFGWLTCLADIFKLAEHKDEWLEKNGYSTITIEKILSNIETAKTIDLWKVIACAGIPNVEKQTSTLLANTFKSFDAFIDATKKFDFTSIFGIGSKTADTIANFDYTEIADAAKYLNITNPIEISSKLYGKTFCITGKLTTFENRNELVKYIEENGGKIMGVTKNLDYLISNDNDSTSSKTNKAKSLGITIISEEDLLNMK